MLDVLKDFPQLFESISMYFKSYPRKISSKLVSNILKGLKEPEIYQIINAYLIHAIEDKLSDMGEREILDFVKTRWQKSSKSLNPMYKKVLLAWLLQNNILKFAIIRVYGYSQNDISAFVNILDSFNDITLHRLYLHDKSLGNYQLGNIGGVTFSSNSALEKKYPHLFALCKEIHVKRLKCDLSHPITKKTKEYTKPIEYRYKYSAVKLLFEGYKELIESW